MLHPALSDIESLNYWKTAPKISACVLGEIVQLEVSTQKSVRARTEKALDILTADADLPIRWVKS